MLRNVLQTSLKRSQRRPLGQTLSLTHQPGRLHASIRGNGPNANNPYKNLPAGCRTNSILSSQRQDLHKSVQSFTTRSFAASTHHNSTTLETSVEDIYQKKTPLEHVLLRPGMYIGSVETTRDTMWILPDKVNKGEIFRMQQQNVEYVPALYKIFDEIIVNAVDNKVRDPSMQRLDVVIDPGNKANGFRPWISIFNDGKGIPIKFHKHEQVYVPELVLGHLLTGSNFDDSTARLTGGRHGYGAKLTNIFSSEFVVETGDLSAKLKYKQVWKNNMRERGEPEIGPLQANEKDFTRVSFSPDLEKFEMDKLTAGMIKVLKKRVYDVAGCLSDVQVTLNGQMLPISGFESYIKTFQYSTTTSSSNEDVLAAGAVATEQDSEAIEDNNMSQKMEYIYSRVNKRWQIGVLPSDVGFTQVSFVNGMSALRGGTHVNYIADQLCRRIVDYVNKKFPEINVTAAQVKPHMALFINCLIENPTFDSQMKEYMSSRVSTYGSSCILSERFSKMVITNSGIVERVVESARARQRSALMKKMSSMSPRTSNKRSVNVPKLEDANWAGTQRSQECALILTEGDSAKALAVAGLAVVGRDQYGVFPLRGKLLNVRDATDAQLSKNAEFAHLCTILGLQMGEVYDTSEKRSSLRYGKVILMTDQDHDGSHIKGLLFNLFHSFWPELLQGNHFLSEFITPIIKVFPKGSRGSKAKKKHSSADVWSFFTLPEYQTWKQEAVANGTFDKYVIKYYKGLGTSTSEEGRTYFSDLKNHIVDFEWSSEEDGHALEMVFSKSRAADRKAWLLNVFDPEAYLDTSEGSVSFKEFVDKELIHFSHADNARSLPNVLDGLKTSQRKVLFACFKRGSANEVKVAQLAGYCSEHTAYHHGEASLHSTIVNMAQDYVGSNNLPLLYPSGQFGTRLQGGKDAASPRYIFTSIQPYTRLLFPIEDDALLKYVDDDGFAVEPTHYVPILPMILMNGSEGIGTGWSTNIPSHHPIQVIDNLLLLLDQAETGDNQSEEALAQVELEPMLPWVKGFRGQMRQVGPHSFISEGIINKINTTTLSITELPVGKWVEDYKKFLWDLVGQKNIRSFSEHHTERDVRFDLVLSRADVSKLTEGKADTSALLKKFKLETSINTSNMHAFDMNGKLKKYDTSEEMLRHFFPIRLSFYGKRKAFMENKQSKEVAKLTNRIRFINQVATEELNIFNKQLTKAQVIGLLQERGFAPASEFEENKLEEDNDTELDEEDETVETTKLNYDYLLNTSLMSFTKEHVERLQKEHDTKLSKLEELRNTTPAQMWRQELIALRQALLKDPEYKA